MVNRQKKTPVIVLFTIAIVMECCGNKAKSSTAMLSRLGWQHNGLVVQLSFR